MQYRRTRRALAAALVMTALAVAGAGTASATTVTPVPGDPLTGSGAVSRTLLTRADLTTGSSTAPVDDSAFAVPANAAPPSHTFEGTLTLSGTSTGGGFKEVVDTYSRTGWGDSVWKHLPAVSVSFVQNGSHLIPTVRGLTYTGSTVWNLAVQPGRVWDENSDNGLTRASFPFALVERNANCVHNGEMTFLFDATTITKVRYQVTQETCAYQKFNMWGQLPATYTQGTPPDATAVKNAYAAEVADRLPSKPISELATDYPASGVDVSRFGAGVTATHMTSYGLLINGVNYTSACTTRYGSYAFCSSMLLPSYSTAKSAFAGVAAMRLQQLYGDGVTDELIRTWVPETASGSGDWTNVTLDNALDMATGNYTSSGYEVDEAGTQMSDFFVAEAYTSKMADALVFPHKAAPGTQWVYHSSDTFLATVAEDNYLKSQAGSGADIFDLLRDDVLTPLKVGPDSLVSERTGNSPTGVPFGGYGMFWTQDSIAKVAGLLNNDAGAIGGTQVLSPAALAATMQQNPADRGLTTTGTTPFRYNNGVWAKQFTPADYPQYSCSFHVPYMSGYGGITVAMAPNGANYYYFSDNNEFSWSPAIGETDKINPIC
ncbi:hypothetical protein [Streptomyces sp. GC420]|uniref:hypothetical protein n=1 Tax=Streptomyces sp. GC420 TaxID=2697568 RepID=UPI0014151209|nr:hypothetical protein [Streptomyces sp. GC420]NBM16629.1 hypothetical protein [Streptomyces sp. GC420]